MLVVARRFLRRSGSEESIHWEDRPSGASAPSLRANPMPFRITQESYRPRVSNRTMVGTLPTRSACKFQEPNGVDNESCHETIGIGTTRPALRREKAVQTSGNSRGGLDVREILPHPAEGEKCLLTSPSIGLPSVIQNGNRNRFFVNVETDILAVATHIELPPWGKVIRANVLFPPR